MLERVWAWIKTQWYKFWDWVHGRKLKNIAKRVKDVRTKPLKEAAREAGKLSPPNAKLEQLQAKLPESKYELKKIGGGIYRAEFRWKRLFFWAHGGTAGIAVRNLLDRIEELDGD